MAYEDVGTVNTGDATKTSWANGVRNNQEDHEARISQNESDIADHETRLNDIEAETPMSLIDVGIYNHQQTANNTDQYFSLTIPTGCDMIRLQSDIGTISGGCWGKHLIRSTAVTPFQTFSIKGVWWNTYAATSSGTQGTTNGTYTGASIPARGLLVAQVNVWYGSQIDYLYLHLLNETTLRFNHYRTNLGTDWYWANIYAEFWKSA